MTDFFEPQLWPFAVALGLVVALAVIEAAGLLIGISVSHWDHGDVAVEPDGVVGNALGWLHFGKVPLLVILIIFLSGFALSGFIIQFAMRGLVGGFMPQLAAVVLALVIAVFGVRVLGGLLSKVIPREETSAVSDASLVGRVGVIVIGAARTGKPAETRVVDEHGATHYVMVEPDEPEQVLSAGTRVLLVRHVNGRRFQAIHNPKPELL